ncbi:aromatic ring-hydroxylating oxygenase subunit alpha [Streptomyces melanogenes]|uniref:aromatic ring-hydroxylating oxygenase subunit alpha n=1 Tax=Streptomyces melanogenes TaxID=67326 RepID=UPI00167E73CD|nr:Rieske 2Fe-2S domain-containing protein [Streptomyces melanogenes]GGP33174.1 (2Fe-2S)-binding protein [Streptomyces melanogenes]
MNPAADTALPYPSGWFCLAPSHELAAGAVLTRALAGEDVVLYRTVPGAAHAVRPHCPHLGAHLGIGGTVEGQNLLCPFHRFAFAPDGTCVSAPGSLPPRARLAQLPVRERNGMLFVWYGHEGARPGWELPDELGTAVPTSWWTRDVATHPQEVIENIVDYRHLAALHGASAREVAPPEVQGPFLRLHLSFGVERHPRAERLFAGTRQEVLLGGLGILLTRLPLPRFGLLFHLWSLPTPIGPWESRLRCAASCTVTDRRRFPGPGLLRTPLTGIAAHAVRRAAVELLEQDIPIWNHKRYEPHPRLARGDEMISRFRRWARQFYPDGGLA